MTAAKSKNVQRRINGFSLIELMIVIVIIGLLATMLIPNLLDALHRTRQRATLGDMRTWATGVSAYMAERGIVPPSITAAGVPGSLVHMDLVPYAIGALHVQDSWKHDFMLYSGDPVSYTVVSFGRDGLAGPCITPATARNWDEDLAVSDGLFVCSPS